MKLIAIDPGTHQSAAVIWDGKQAELPQIVDNTELLNWLRNKAPHLPIACEMVACYGMAVGREVFETCVLIGRMHEIWFSKGLSFHTVYRRDVKLHLCGSMKAKDQNIRQALIDRFGVVGTKKNKGPLFGISSHLWSALAVAVTYRDAMTPRPEISYPAQNQGQSQQPPTEALRDPSPLKAP